MQMDIDNDPNLLLKTIINLVKGDSVRQKNKESSVNTNEKLNQTERMTIEIQCDGMNNLHTGDEFNTIKNPRHNRNPTDAESVVPLLLLKKINDDPCHQYR